jgi:transcription termination factor NusB
MNRRREAREIAFRAVYQADVTGEPADRCLGEIVEDVALDEAIEIAKKYGMETSGSFVNGILDRIAHEARPSVG